MLRGRGILRGAAARLLGFPTFIHVGPRAIFFGLIENKNKMNKVVKRPCLGLCWKFI